MTSDTVLLKYLRQRLHAEWPSSENLQRLRELGIKQVQGIELEMTHGGWDLYCHPSLASSSHMHCQVSTVAIITNLSGLASAPQTGLTMLEWLDAEVSFRLTVS
jgi:hypothetical protein